MTRAPVKADSDSTHGCRFAMRPCTVAVTLLGMIALVTAQWTLHASLLCMIQYPGCKVRPAGRVYVLVAAKLRLP